MKMCNTPGCVNEVEHDVHEITVAYGPGRMIKVLQPSNGFCAECVQGFVQDQIDQLTPEVREDQWAKIGHGTSAAMPGISISYVASKKDVFNRIDAECRAEIKDSMVAMSKEAKRRRIMQIMERNGFGRSPRYHVVLTEMVERYGGH